MTRNQKIWALMLTSLTILSVTSLIFYFKGNIEAAEAIGIWILAILVFGGNWVYDTYFEKPKKNRRR